MPKIIFFLAVIAILGSCSSTESEIEPSKQNQKPTVYLQDYNTQKLIKFSENIEIKDELTDLNWKTILTLDPQIQQKAQIVLTQNLERSEADDGEIIVLNPQTGEILAMTSLKSEKVTYPGPLIKTITASIAMELAISLEDLFPSPPDCQQNPLSCSSSMQLVAPTSYQELITNSTSLFPNIAFKIGQKKLKYYFSQFGLLADPDLAINYSTNSLSDGHRRQLADFARISIGQDWAVNNLSLVSAYSVFANNGQRVRPTIIKNQEKAVQRVISNQTAQAITAILINNYQNTQEVGSKLATSYTFAGKGGTTYASKNQKTIISNFIGYPAETNPSFIVFVSLSFTQVPEESWGFMLTKKPFEEISEFIIKHYALKP